MTLKSEVITEKPDHVTLRFWNWLELVCGRNNEFGTARQGNPRMQEGELNGLFWWGFERPERLIEMQKVRAKLSRLERITKTQSGAML